MLHVVLDTNIFRHDPNRKKVAFRALSKLASYKFVKIYVPYVVYKEFVSQEMDDYLIDFDNFINGFRGLLRKHLPESVIQFLKNTDQKVGSIEKEIKTFLDEKFLKWMADNNAELVPIKDHHGQKVIDAYFDGNPPFATIKNKKDFPDAFITQCRK